MRCQILHPVGAFILEISLGFLLISGANLYRFWCALVLRTLDNERFFRGVGCFCPKMLHLRLILIAQVIEAETVFLSIHEF